MASILDLIQPNVREQMARQNAARAEQLAVRSAAGAAQTRGAVNPAAMARLGAQTQADQRAANAASITAAQAADRDAHGQAITGLIGAGAAGIMSAIPGAQVAAPAMSGLTQQGAGAALGTPAAQTETPGLQQLVSFGGGSALGNPAGGVGATAAPVTAASTPAQPQALLHPSQTLGPDQLATPALGAAGQEQANIAAIRDIRAQQGLQPLGASGQVQMPPTTIQAQPDPMQALQGIRVPQMQGAPSLTQDELLRQILGL